MKNKEKKNKLPEEDWKDEIDNLLGEDAYNEGAFMFEDNKMRFCFTPDELVKKREAILALFSSKRAEWIAEERKRLLKEFNIIIGNNEPTNTGLPMIDEPNIYMNILKTSQRNMLKDFLSQLTPEEGNAE